MRDFVCIVFVVAFLFFSVVVTVVVFLDVCVSVIEVVFLVVFVVIDVIIIIIGPVGRLSENLMDMALGQFDCLVFIL